MTIVLLLVLVWAVALAPLAWRKLLDIQAISEVARFRHRIGTLRTVAPVIAGQSTPFARQGPASSGAQRSRLEDAPCTVEQRRAIKVRAERRAARRRRTLAWMSASVLTTLIFGAIPGLHFFWYLSVMSVLLTCCYLGLLAWSRHEEQLAAERARKVVALPTWAPQREHVEQGARAVASVGGSPLTLARRPAFVLVDAPS